MPLGIVIRGLESSGNGSIVLESETIDVSRVVCITLYFSFDVLRYISPSDTVYTSYSDANETSS